MPAADEGCQGWWSAVLHGDEHTFGILDLVGLIGLVFVVGERLEVVTGGRVEAHQLRLRLEGLGRRLRGVVLLAPTGEHLNQEATISVR